MQVCDGPEIYKKLNIVSVWGVETSTDRQTMADRRNDRDKIKPRALIK